ncbi:hypothetical protein E2562_036317 [Oryza meyeriana var. granulata]|uniref:Uncharacterized protein n=1 Tax=Oryza meyeriana var. granulata TaxID=110450 RepID=A0A6G1DAI1_9ORYZ|nr:hypothetical protein E2562_036317 [Oryza meyeriana var. granulata]
MASFMDGLDTRAPPRHCPSLRRLDDQPEWLKGGKLRDYQLEGLNFLHQASTLEVPYLVMDQRWRCCPARRDEGAGGRPVLEERRMRVRRHGLEKIDARQGLEKIGALEKIGTTRL